MSDWIAQSKPPAPESRVPHGILAFMRAGFGHAYPTELVRGQGAYVWDARGRKYVDWVSGKGAVTLGHARPEVDERAFERARNGFLMSGCPEEYELVAARLARLLPRADKAIFCKNGNDAVQIAIRLARVFTGREAIASAGYHGWRAEPGVDEFGYDLDALAALLEKNRGSLAAVLVTPEPAFLDRAWLERCERIAKDAGALFLSDEVRAGLRLAHGGASELFGVTPDLICLSKGLANGYPLAAVTGRADVLDASARTFVFGTYYAEAVALAASDACLEIYEREPIIERMRSAGSALMRGLDDLFAVEGVAARTLGPAPMFQILFDDERAEDVFYDLSAEKAVLFFQNDGQCPSSTHGGAEAQSTLETCAEVVRAIRRDVQGGRKQSPGELSPSTLARYAERRMIRASALSRNG